MKDRLKPPEFNIVNGEVYFTRYEENQDILFCDYSRIFSKVRSQVMEEIADHFFNGLNGLSDEEFKILKRVTYTAMDIIENNRDNHVNFIRHSFGEGKTTAIMHIIRRGIMLFGSLKQTKSKYQQFKQIGNAKGYMLVGFKNFTGYEEDDNGNYLTQGNEKEVKRKTPDYVQAEWRYTQINQIRREIHNNDTLTVRNKTRISHSNFWDRWKNHNRTGSKCPVNFISNQRLLQLNPSKFETLVVDEGVEDVAKHEALDIGKVKKKILKNKITSYGKGKGSITSNDIQKIPLTGKHNATTHRFREIRKYILALLFQIEEEIKNSNTSPFFTEGVPGKGTTRLTLLDPLIEKLESKYLSAVKEIKEFYNEFYNNYNGTQPYHQEIQEICKDKSLCASDKISKIRKIEETGIYCRRILKLVTNKILKTEYPDGNIQWYAFTPKIFDLYQKSDKAESVFVTDATCGKRYVSEIAPKNYKQWKSWRPEVWNISKNGGTDIQSEDTELIRDPKLNFIGEENSHENLEESNLETDHIQVHRSYARSSKKNTWRNDELITEDDEPTELGKEIFRGIFQSIRDGKMVLCVGKKSFAKVYQDYFESEYPDVWNDYEQDYDMKLFWYFDELEGENVGKDADECYIFQCKRLRPRDYFRQYAEQYYETPPDYVDNLTVFNSLVVINDPGASGMRSSIEVDKAISKLKEDTGMSESEVLNLFQFLDTHKDEIFLGYWDDLFKRNVVFPNFDAGFRKRNQLFISGKVYHFSINPRGICSKSISETEWLEDKVDSVDLIMNWENIESKSLYRNRSFSTERNSLKSWAKTFRDFKILTENGYSEKEAVRELKEVYSSSTVYRHKDCWEDL